MKMKILELYAGTRSIGKAFERKGHEVFSVEYDNQHPNIDLYDDVNNLTYDRIIELFGVPDVIWASPDCTTYSIAGIYHHRIKEDDQLKPISDKAVLSDKTVRHVIDLMNRFHYEHDTILFIENPRGVCERWTFSTI